jgi:hypothetical protein
MYKNVIIEKFDSTQESADPNSFLSTFFSIVHRERGDFRSFFA